MSDNKAVLFLMGVVLILVFFVAQGITTYWNELNSNAIFRKETDTLDSKCGDYRGNGSWQSTIDKYDEESITFRCIVWTGK